MKTIYTLAIIALTALNSFTQNKTGSITDIRDGQTYTTKTYTVKTQTGSTEKVTWMTQDLNFKTNGSLSLKGKLPAEMKPGMLYPWTEAAQACPEGWIVASDSDWDALLELFGGANIAGKVLKTRQLGGDNSENFNITPSGMGVATNYAETGSAGYYWTSSKAEGYVGNYNYKSFSKRNNAVGQNMMPPNIKMPVRCIKKEENINISDNTTSNKTSASKHFKALIQELNSTVETQRKRKGYLKYNVHDAKGLKQNLPGPYTLKPDDVKLEGNTIRSLLNKDQKNIIIPEKINGVTITKIGPNAFARRELMLVELPNTIETIDKYAFHDNAIIELHIPESVKEIGISAFNQNALTELTIPASVEEIKYSAFSENFIYELNLPAKIKLGDAVFASNRITKINGQLSPGFIYGRTTTGEEDLSKLNSYGGKSLTISNLPKSIKIIGYGAFYHCGIESINLHEGITKIEAFAFAGNNLINVTIPNSVKEVARGAFAQNLLQKVSLPQELRIIERAAFSNNAIEQIEIPTSVKYIRKAAFSINQITKLVIPSSVEQIGPEAFLSNKITDLTIPESVIVIGSEAFNNNQVKVLNGEPSNGLIYAKHADGSIDKTRLISYAGNTSLLDFLPDTIEEIGFKAIGEFYGASMADQVNTINLPANLEAFYSYAMKFGKYTKTESITLPPANGKFTQWRTSHILSSKKDQSKTFNSGDKISDRELVSHNFVADGLRYIIKFRPIIDKADKEKDNLPYVYININNNTYITQPEYFNSIILPKGDLPYTAEVEVNGETYKANGVFNINDDKSISITLKKQ